MSLSGVVAAAGFFLAAGFRSPPRRVAVAGFSLPPRGSECAKPIAHKPRSLRSGQALSPSKGARVVNRRRLACSGGLWPPSRRCTGGVRATPQYAVRFFNCVEPRCFAVNNIAFRRAAFGVRFLFVYLIYFHHDSRFVRPFLSSFVLCRTKYTLFATIYRHKWCKNNLLKFAQSLSCPLSCSNGRLFPPQVFVEWQENSDTKSIFSFNNLQTNDLEAIISELPDPVVAAAGSSCRWRSSVAKGHGTRAVPWLPRPNLAHEALKQP